MKKLLIVLGLSAFCFASYSQQSAAPIGRFLPLLSGYNVLAGTNGTYIATTNTVQLGQSNVLYTTYNGQALYSLTTNLIFAGVNGVITNYLNTNTIAPDAFKVVTLSPDVNGDINANAALWVFGGNTNFEPNQYWTTNNLTYQVSVYTNGTGVLWPLAIGNGYPNWNYPATPNVYPTAAATATNVVVVNLYTAPIGSDLQGGFGDTLAQALTIPMISESSPSFSATFTEPASSPWVVSTNLPTVFLQHARKVWCSITVTPGATSVTSTNELINQVGIYQPQP